MSQARRDVLKTLMLSLWGLATLVLLFVVVLLVNEMLKSGQDPLAALRTPVESAAAGRGGRPAAATAVGAREVLLYFADAEGASLRPEPVSLPVTDSTLENCRTALERLLAGPREDLTPILPDTAELRALYLLENGDLVVDFSREVLLKYARFKSASLEALMAYGVINTLAQPALEGKTGGPVRRVRFLFEGAPPQDAFPGHIDLSRALAPDPRWSAAAPGTPPDGA